MIIRLLLFYFTFLSFLFIPDPSNKYKKGHIKYSSAITVNQFKTENIEYYRLEIDQAFALLKNQKQIIDLELNNNEKVDILAIAFPEIIRYNSFSDFIETSSNRILYINRGKKTSDFSTGYFQMKPSFIEDLENYVASNTCLQQYNSILIKKKTGKADLILDLYFKERLVHNYPLSVPGGRVKFNPTENIPATNYKTNTWTAGNCN